MIGNISQSTQTWWRNKTKTGAATTFIGHLAEMLNIYNSCALGTGGPPDLVLVDQTTFELTSLALYQQYRAVNSANDYPFTNVKLPFGNGGTLMVMDDKVPNVFAGTLDTTTTTGGTAYFINTKFFRMRYIPDRNFEMLTDENGKTFAKPINQDSRVGHCAWMGAPTMNNRRKHGVLGKIARTLTVS